MNVKVDILVEHGATLYYPPITEGINVEWQRRGRPGKLTFNIARDEHMQIEEGDAVRMQVNGQDFFFGFVFTKRYTSGDTVAVTVYDQLRYLKNKETYVYENKTADSVVSMIAADFRLNAGALTSTGWTIPHRVEDNSTLFDIIQNALDETIKNTSRMFVLYDDCGRLMLRDVETMKLPLLLDGSTVSDFDYKSSIDRDVFNQVKVVHEDTESGARGIYMAKNSANIQKWGILQLLSSVETAATGPKKASALLTLHNRKQRTLTVRNALGDARVRAGNSIVCMLELGDITIQNYMLVDGVRHTFTQNQHLMELRLRGGLISG